MRKLFYTTAKLLLCLVFVLSSVSVFAEDAIPLYEKYGYRDSYKYNDEMITNALKVTIPQIRTAYSATVLYEPVSFDAEYALGKLRNIREKAEKTLAQGDVAAAVLDDIRKNTDKYLKFGYQKEMKTEGVFTGGGVVIGEDGYIATNSPVVGMGEEFKKKIYYYELREEMDNIVLKLINGFEKYGVSFSNEEIASFCDLILGFAVKNLQIIDDEVEIEVWFPASYGTTKVYAAKIVADVAQNTAILKIDAKNLVALKLSEKYPELNSKVVSAGFNDTADSHFRKPDNEETDLEIAVENGSVAWLSQIDGTKYKAIGITCALSGRNGGGPSVDANLDIEGLNTYVNAQDNPLRSMVPARLVKKLSSDLEIGQGEVSKTFMTGLQLLQDGYGPAAVECFRKVAEYQPETPYINNIIELAESAPDNQYVVKKDKKVVLITGVAGLAVVFIALIVILIIAGKKKKKTAVTSVDGAVPLYPVDNGIEGESVNVVAAASEDTVPITSYRPPVPEDAPRPVITLQNTEKSGAADLNLK